MNVLHLISSRLGYYGAERVVVTLSAALEEMGVTSIVAAFHNTVRTTHLEVLEEATARGINTERILCNGRFDWKAVQAIRDIVDRNSIDVVHCHGIKPVLYALLASPKGVALISTCHLWTFESGKAWAISAFERCMLHAFDRVVAVSDQISPQLRRFGLKSDLIYNGIELAMVRGSDWEIRKRMNWGSRPVIGVIGRLAKQKGHQYLLRAAPEVLRNSPDTLFVFAGDGPERDSLEVEAKSLGVHESVRFLGVRQDIPDILASIDILAMPSLSEGLPMALLEAMASAKPVVASAVGAIPRVIQNRANGILIAAGDVSGLAGALQDLLRSKELRLELGRSARMTVEASFSAVSMANQYLEIYRATSVDNGQPVHIV
jgi:glycosyltransferase involved in cell wall biosynthesis